MSGETRDDAARLLAELRGNRDPDLDAILERLDADAVAVRAWAVWQVAEHVVDDPRAVTRRADDLYGLLADSNLWIRRGAARALERLAAAHPPGAKDATHRLTDALADDDPLVRDDAILAFEHLAVAEPRAVAGAIERLGVIARRADDPRLGRHAREGLARIGDQLEDADGAQLVDESQFVADVAYALGTPGIEAIDEIEVVAENDDPEDRRRRAARRRRRSAVIEGTRPPGEEPPSLTGPVTAVEFEYEDHRRADALLLSYRARGRTGSRSEVLPVAFSVLREGPRTTESVGSATRAAFQRWERIDDHPSVVSTLGYGGSTPWLATAVADGQPFEAYATRSGLSEALFYARRLVRAVAHAHGRDVIHGALSPRAIGFVEPIQAAWDVPVIAGWGVGPVILEHLAQLPVAEPFAAPEHVAPAVLGPTDQATDVYGLGALLYALFAGCSPKWTSGDTVVDRFETLEPGDAVPENPSRPVPPSSVAADVPPEAGELVTRALSWDRMDRHETVVDLAAALDALCDDHADWA